MMDDSEPIGLGTRLFVLLQHVLPQHWLSRVTAMAARSRWPWLKSALVDVFVKTFEVDLSEAALPNASDYPDFNAFFTRALRDGARPIDGAKNVVLAPADGTVSQLGTLDGQHLLQAKGRYFTTSALLGDEISAAKYAGGSFMTVYLSPRDYHRVHMPGNATLMTMRHVPGRLFSVNNGTAALVDRLFARNERVVCEFDSEHGPFSMVLVGAMVVASIETVWAGQITPPGRHTQTWYYDTSLQQIRLVAGQEMGRFQLGSTVIMLFPPKTVCWDDSLRPGCAQQMGTRIGTFID